MSCKTTIWKMPIQVFCYSVTLLFFAILNLRGQVTTVNANVLVSSSHATNPSNAILNNGSFTTLNSYGGIAVGIGSYNGSLELEFPSTVPAGKTTYVKLDFDQDVLNALVGGGLGGALADLTGTLVLGNHYFTVSAKNNATTIVTYSSQNNFASENGKLVVDASGNFYFAITPNQPYNRILVEDFTNALLLGTSNSMKVYKAFYTEGTSSCDIAFATSFDGTGGTVDLIGLGNAGVDNSERAIDADVNSYSHIGLGALAAAGTISQTVYFSAQSNPTDQIHVTMQLDNPAILNLGLADGLKIEALNGTNVVYTIGGAALLDLDLLGLLSGGQKVTLAITPGQSFDRVKLTLSSLVQLNVTKGLRLYDVYKSPAAPTVAVASQNLSVCGAQSVTLFANTASENELVWFDSATSNTPIAVTAYNAGYVTPVLNNTTTYYVAARKTGCAPLSSRVPVKVTVITKPVASDISVSSSVSADCSGVAVLSPSTSISNSMFNYYTDQSKTQEIVTGFSGHAGITYSKNDVTGALTISGLTATNTPRTYYIAVEVNGTCENDINTLLPVQVVVPSQTALNVSAMLSGCGSVNLANAILNFDASGATTYSFFDNNHNPITAAQATEIEVSGTYYIKASNSGSTCASAEMPVSVTVHSFPQLQVSPASYTVAVGGTVTLQATSDAAITWYDYNGVFLTSTTVGPFTQSGTYNYTVVANNGNCIVSRVVPVVVTNPAECAVFTERVYAETQTSGAVVTGGVFNDTAAIDHNPQTYSTVTSGIGALGVGTTWQTLQWNNTIAAGTPVSIKLGTQYSGLELIGAISVVGTKRDGAGVPVNIGTIQPLSGNLVNLLPGENSFEFTFVPSDGTGPRAYDGVKIIVGSTVTVAQNAKVYEAYFERVANPLVCQPGDVEDIYYGVYDLGVGALTSTVSVANPWNSVDTDDASYATMYSGVGVLSESRMMIKFRTPSQPSDRLKIRLTKPGSTLSVGAIAGFSVQRYMGNVPVGAPISASGATADVELLNGGNELIFTSNTPAGIFDRVLLRLGGAANVLDFLQVHYVKREAAVDLVGSNDNQITICQGGQVSVVADPCTSYKWYDAEYNGNMVANGPVFVVPSNLVPGIYTFYVQPVRGGCEVLSRTKITVTIRPASPSVLISSILVNAATQTTICTNTGSVVLTAQLNSTPAVTNPVYYWYSFDGTNQVIIPGQNTNTLQLNGLSPGTYTYYVGVSSNEFCETLQPNRTPITFTILPYSIANDITISDVQLCNQNNTVLQPSSSLNNAQFNWYFSNDTTQPITNGTVNGITYLIGANGSLTVSGLTTANSPYTYYVSVQSATTCQNAAGTLQDVVIILNTTPTPTTTNATQNFCQSDNPTVASLQVNETGVIWYDAASGGNVVPSTTGLVNGMTYYAGITNSATGCSSSPRLAVTVTLNNEPTPTTNNTTQNFCSTDNPTVASLQVNETGVIWYDAASGGNAIPSSTALTNGMTYYAATTNSVTGCSSSPRLAVTVNVNTTLTPTTNNATQNFCQSDSPTVASLQVNETGVIWYDAPTGGNVIPSTTALTNGMTYYAGITNSVTGCSSSPRLAVTVNINTAPTPTTNNATQSFCQSDNPTVASLQVNETGVIWYDAPSGGNAIPSTTALTNGMTYYAGITNSVTGCSSSPRLAVTATLNNEPTPTTNNTTQNFCSTDNPTIASLQVNETGVIWYDAANGGNIIPSATPLVDGMIYYAGITNASTGCSSTVLLSVSANINVTMAPTTNDTTQDFCPANNPTVASLQVNETGVTWYDAPSGGNAIPTSTPLVNGTVYYGELTNAATGCASNRLAITANLSGIITATITGGSATACVASTVTYTTESNMNNYDWAFTSGGQIVSGGGSNDSTITILWNQPGANSVSVSYTNVAVCNASGSATFNLNVQTCTQGNDLVITKTVNNPTPFVDENVVFTITVSNSGSAQYTNVVVNELLPSGYAFVSSTVSAGTYNSTTGIWNIPVLNAGATATLQITATVLFSGDYLNTATIVTSSPEEDEEGNVATASTSPLCLIVYNEFTPNEDGSNDVFTIQCAEYYPNNKLEVYNRYGNLVYKTHGYKNDWKGTANVNGTLAGNVLPAGTYYYIFETGDAGRQTKSGWLYIMR